jgi:hypothetical protein
MTIHLTDHALVRLAQRGILANDIELIMLLGTEVEDGYLILERDLLVTERQLKRALGIVQRLRGKRLVMQHNKLITAYRASHRKEKLLLRRIEERELSD